MAGQFLPGPAGGPHRVASSSAESGRDEIYVQSFRAPRGRRWRPRARRAPRVSRRRRSRRWTWRSRRAAAYPNHGDGNW